jgi:hypothetical protein
MTTNFPSAIAVGDLNGDGSADLALISYVSMEGNPGGSADTTAISVLQGDGKGNFTSSTSLLSETFMYESASSPESLVVGDFNGDGIADLAQPFWSGYNNGQQGMVNILLAE